MSTLLTLGLTIGTKPCLQGILLTGHGLGLFYYFLYKIIMQLFLRLHLTSKILFTYQYMPHKKKSKLGRPNFKF